MERWDESSVAVSLAADAPRPSVRIGFRGGLIPDEDLFYDFPSLVSGRRACMERNGSWMVGRTSGGSVEGRSIDRQGDWLEERSIECGPYVEGIALTCGIPIPTPRIGSTAPDEYPASWRLAVNSLSRRKKFFTPSLPPSLPPSSLLEKPCLFSASASAACFQSRRRRRGSSAHQCQCQCRTLTLYESHVKSADGNCSQESRGGLSATAASWLHEFSDMAVFGRHGGAGCQDGCSGFR